MTLSEHLNEKFPDHNFVARTYVAWTDGPTRAEVEEALGDLYEVASFQRTLSRAFQVEMATLVQEQSGEPFSETRWYEGGFHVRPGGERTRPGYGNEQVGQLAEMVSR